MNQRELYEEAAREYPGIDPAQTVQFWASLAKLDAEHEEARRAAGIPEPIIRECVPPEQDRPVKEMPPPGTLDEVRQYADMLYWLLGRFDGDESVRLRRSLDAYLRQEATATTLR
jgi:hypothetical protein